MKTKFFYLMFTFFSFMAVSFHSYSQDNEQKQSETQQDVKLVIRVDDIGFCHAINMAIKKILEEGVVTSISVMVNSPWLDEAVEILKQHPEVSIGVHTTLNSEWREYRLGPVLPVTEVPSLVDEYGKFFGSRAALMANKPKVEEVGKEIRAQIEIAKKKGLNISYIDHHMSAAVNTAEFQDEFEKIAKEYNLAISRYFEEKDPGTVYSAAPDKKLEKGLKILDSMTTPGLYLLVIHPGMDVPEMAAMTDLNKGGLKFMSKHRQAEADMLCSPEFKEAIKKNNIKLIGYKELAKEGLEKMKRPYNADKYEDVYAKAIEDLKK